MPTAAPACTPHQTVDEALQCALDLLKDPERWIQGKYSRTVQGEEIRENDLRRHDWSPEDPPAQFCLVGAVEYCADEAVCHTTLEYVAQAINNEFERELDNIDSIPDFNDNEHTEHREVVAVLERALKNYREGDIPNLDRYNGDDDDDDDDSEWEDDEEEAPPATEGTTEGS